MFLKYLHQARKTAEFHEPVPWDDHEADPNPCCLFCASLGTCEDAESLDGTCERFELLTLTQHGEVMTVPMEPLSFRCPGCESHHLGWCRAVPGKAFFNIEYLATCPLGAQ